MSLPLHLTEFNPSDNVFDKISAYLRLKDSFHTSIVFMAPFLIILIALIIYVIKTKIESKPGKNNLDAAVLVIIFISILTLTTGTRLIMNVSHVTGTAYYESKPFTAEKIKIVNGAKGIPLGTYVTTNDGVKVFVSGQPPIKFREYVTGSTRGVKDIKVEKDEKYKIITKKQVIMDDTSKTLYLKEITRVPNSYAFRLVKIKE